jgi:hypothetical protein
MQPIRDKANKRYLVVGCHGSATSLIAQGLKRCGIGIGNYVIQDINEDRDFKNINKWILHRAGGTWFDPPTEEAILAVDVEQEIEALLQGYKGDKWAVKDPRASLTGKQYLPHLEGDVYLFCCFRRPGRLVKSLQRKMSLIEDSAFIDQYIHKGLVDKYNRSIISLIEEFCEL